MDSLENKNFYLESGLDYSSVSEHDFLLEIKLPLWAKFERA